jgi:hypothetical protein
MEQHPPAAPEGAQRAHPVRSRRNEEEHVQVWVDHPVDALKVRLDGGGNSDENHEFVFIQVKMRGRCDEKGDAGNCSKCATCRMIDSIGSGCKPAGL